MKKFVFGVAVGLIAFGVLRSQTSAIRMMPIWNEGIKKYEFYVLSNKFTLNNGIIDLNVRTRFAGKVMSWDATAGGYRIPASTGATPTNVVVFVNGLRYSEGVDFTVKGTLVVPIPPASNWPPPAQTVCSVDWEQ